MRIQIKSLTRSDRFKCKFGIFNLILKFNDYTVVMKRGSLNAIPHFRFFPRLKSDNECLAIIGDFCEFADTAILLGGEHPTGLVHSTFGSSYEILLSQSGSEFMPTTKGPIQIGPCCVFSVRTTVVSGSRVGYGSTVGAGAVVTGEYSPYSVILGVPGKSTGTRVPSAQSLFLEKYPWWTASYDWITQSIKDIQSFTVPTTPLIKDPHSDKFLVIRLGLEDAKISSTELDGLLIGTNLISRQSIPKMLTDYLDGFDGTGPVEIDTNIWTKCLS